MNIQECKIRKTFINCNTRWEKQSFTLAAAKETRTICMGRNCKSTRRMGHCRCTLHSPGNRHTRCTWHIFCSSSQTSSGGSLGRAMDTFIFVGESSLLKRAFVKLCRQMHINRLWLTECVWRIFLIGTFFSDAKNMASDVRNIIIKILIEKGQMTEQQAQAYLKKMETQKRLSSDVWS